MDNLKPTIKEFVVVALVAAVIGVVYTLLDYAYMPLSAVLGVVFMELTFGIYILSAALPMYIVRKPGIAFFGALVTAAVNLLLGSPYGLQLVLAGVLQAVGIEVGYLVGGKYKGNTVNIVVGSVLGALCVFGRDMFFWSSPVCYGAGIAAGVVVVRLLSAVIIGAALSKLITLALVKAGVLKGFKCAQQD